MLRRVTRSPFLFWLGVCALAGITGLSVSHALAQARAGAGIYGQPRPVVVAVKEVEVGARIAGSDIDVRVLPAAAIPPGALRSAAQARGRIALAPLFRGEPLLDAHLAGPGRRGLAAMLTPGVAAVGVPTDDAAPRVRRGDLVDVLATVDPVPPGSDPTFAVARAARVLDVRSGAVTLAVASDDAPRLAYAIARGTVLIALIASASPGS